MPDKRSSYNVKLIAVIIQIVFFTISFNACQKSTKPQGQQEPQREQVSQEEQRPKPIEREPKIEQELSDNVIIEARYQPSSSSGLPVIKVDTVGNAVVDQKVEWIPASYTLYDNNGTKIQEGTTGIRGRGNTTWGMPKRPYNLNLDTATGFLGMPAQRRWSLLANYSDKTLLRTDIAFNKMAAIYNNLAWTPRTRFVDLYLNGSYRGVYQLTESIRLDPNRVNINPVISGSNGNGGYLLEVCERLEDEFNFVSNNEVSFNCSSPDSNLDVEIQGTSTTIFEKIKAFVQEAEDALYGNDFANPSKGWQNYLDLDTFVDWYLISEITKNSDSIFYSSVYMYYDPRKEKLCMGPIWDFDLSMGNINYNNSEDPTGFRIKGAHWIYRLFRDPVFVAAVKKRWNENYAQLSEISGYIDLRAEFIHEAQQQNFSKWLILDKYVWPNSKVTGSYAGEIAYLKSWLAARIAWLNAEINKL